MPAASSGHRGMNARPGSEGEGPDGAGRAYEHTRFEVHRHGPYLDVDGELDVSYGDGTPQSLLDRLREPPTDPWQSCRDGWQAVHPAWERERRDEADG